MRGRFPISILALFLLPILGLASPARAAEPLLLGMSAAFTGSSRGMGIEYWRGAMAYFHHVNQTKGGLFGREIRLLARDDGYEPIPAVRNTLNLLQKDKVYLLFNYVGTPTVTRVLPLLKMERDNNPLLFFPITGAQPQREPPYFDFVFNLRPSYRQETKGLVDTLYAMGRKRIAVFYQVDAYGRSGWDGVRLALRQYGLNIVSEATYNRGVSFEQSMAEQVTIIRKASPDAVISIGSYQACAAFIRDARDAEFNVPICNLSFVSSENLLKLLEQQCLTCDSERYCQRLIVSQVLPSYENLDIPIVREYRELMSKPSLPLPPELASALYTPFTHSFASFEGFCNAKALVAIFQRIGYIPPRDCLKQAVEFTGSLDIGLDVPIIFTPDRHQGLNTVYFTTVRDGSFAPLDLSSMSLNGD